MFDEEISLPTPTAATLRLYRRRADAGRPVRGRVLVLHGLAEHAARYAGFAEWLSARGFVVYAPDHRGHGATTAPDAPIGRFARRKGADLVLRDLECVLAHAQAQDGHLPTIVFGHSMGGFLALSYAERHGADLAGLCIWNADAAASLSYRAARAALKVEKALKGSDVPSLFMHRATFAAWARQFPRRRTEFDWLSSDPDKVEAYRNDPLCGWMPTVSLWADLVDLVLTSGSPRNLGTSPRSLPCHVLGGSEDPATARGRAILKLARALRRAGLEDVTAFVVDGARHETLNERRPMREAALSSLDAFLDHALEVSEAHSGTGLRTIHTGATDERLA